mmetsp:Transcript_17895/g.27823  ORF Transcript_17895/g.27823 Transcript_17895/m.27823 type:complete len:129 (-) Transcript_17895:6-392(-)
MCGVKEVWLYLKLGNMRGAIASFLESVRAAAFCCMSIVSEVVGGNVEVMNLSEAISIIENSSLMLVSPRSMEAIRSMIHTNRVLRQDYTADHSADEEVVQYDASTRKKARLQHHQERIFNLPTTIFYC